MEKLLTELSGGVSRRDFIKASAVAAVAAVALPGKVFAAAPDKIKVGLIGCGGRGNDALSNCLAAASKLGLQMEVVAVGDWFKDRADNAGKRRGVPAERCFAGPDAYKKVLATDINLALLVTSPNFRPLHFEAAIAAGKNVFMEKPVAVDPPGARRIIAAGEVAKTKGLAVVAGTQRRHQTGYRRNQYAVEKGAIGKIVCGNVWWCGGALWKTDRKPGESDADYMVRNWVSFTEMSGDHVVEQHVHNLDVANWFIGHPPVWALGFGGRARRKTGDQFDFFSVELNYDDECYVHSMCRQVNGTYSRVSEHFIGTEGSTWGEGAMKSSKVIDIPQFFEHGGPYVQEHIDLLQSIIDGKPLNEARNVAEATMTGIMCRIASYTGQLVKWTDLMENKGSPWFNLALSPCPEDFEKGPVTAPKDDVVAVPGRD
ncbi:MAG: Gfo/Idh/MocA family oxidoreductase [bacterium]